MNLGRLRQRIYSPPPLTTRALPREPWNPSPKGGRFQPRRRLGNVSRNDGSAGASEGETGRVQKGGSRGRQGDDDPGLKRCDARPGEAGRHGDSQCHRAAGGWRGIQIHGACDDKRILSEIRSRATALRTIPLPPVCTYCPAPPDTGGGRRSAAAASRRIERQMGLWYRKHPLWRRSSAGQSSGIIIRVS